MNRIAVCAGLALAAALAPVKAEEPGALAPILACRGISEDAARLACFDAATSSETLAEAPAEPAAPAIAAAPAAPALTAEAALEEEFGAEDLPRAVVAAKKEARGEDPEEVNSFATGVVEVSKTASGAYLIVLDNGQVWRQLDSDDGSPRVPRNLEGLTATVKKASFGSYQMRLGEAKPAIRVKRLR